MKNIIIANWKMNPLTLEEAEKLFQGVEKGIGNINKTEVVICPPFIYLLGFKSQVSGLKLGAQDCYSQEKGAFTGEVSPLMLKNIGCDYVIIGHSERRKYQKESDGMINEKIKAVLKADLKPILCIDNIDQIKKDIEGLSQEDIKNLAVAYEPIWAIGTGKACEIPEAQEMNVFIKNILGKEMPILYGGSVNSQNAEGYIKEAGFQGLLVGGVSLKPEEFVEIIKKVDLI
jgi:triosephosphate isomerase